MPSSTGDDESSLATAGTASPKIVWGGVAEPVVAKVQVRSARTAPLVERVRGYLDDPAELDRVLAAGAARAREVAGVTLKAVYDSVGFLPPAS